MSHVLVRRNWIGDRLEIETDYDEVEEHQKLFGLFSFGSNNRSSTNYTLKIPRTSDLAVDIYSAATTVSTLESKLPIDAYSGSLTATRLTGALRADPLLGQRHGHSSRQCGGSSRNRK